MTTIDTDMMTSSMQERMYLGYSAPPEEYADLSVGLIVTDPETYEMICRQVGVPYGSNILLNQLTWHHPEGGRSVIAPFVFSNQTLQISGYYDNEIEFDLTLHGELTIGNIPNELLTSTLGSLTVIVPELDAMHYSWFVTTDDAAGFLEYAETVVKEMDLTESGVSRFNFINIDEESDAMQDIGRLVMVFIYGFIIMLTLIGLTNVISTISTNVRSRSREFAILQSVGMTRGGLGRMLNLESILCSVKSLIIGVPLGILGAYVVHNYMGDPVEFAFTIPWIPILQCSLGVLAVTWITMRYAASRLRGGSIVEKIRADGIV